MFAAVLLMFFGTSCGDNTGSVERESGEGENCENTTDCISGLICADYVCIDPDKENNDAVPVDSVNEPDDETVDKVVDDDENPDDVVTDDDGAEDEADAGDQDELPDNDTDSGNVEDDSYPEETATSNKVGDVACNMSFYDELNAEHKLEEWYYKNNPEEKLIWLIFAAYDCMFSKSLRNNLSSVITQDMIDKGLSVILIMNGNLTGPNPGNEPSALSYLKETMVQSDSINAAYTYGYFKNDQQVYFYKFINEGYPVNVFVDTSNMKIVRHFEGWDSSYVEQTADYINGFLD